MPGAPQPIISVSGLRGIVGESLTPEVAARFAASFAAGLPPGSVALGRDSRPSGGMLAGAIAAALRAMGRNVVEAGIVATPTLGVLVQASRAAGGIQVTASHNPAPYNGMKLFGGQGRVMPAAEGEGVVERYHRGELPWARHDKIGSVTQHQDPQAEHLSRLLAIVDVERIRNRGFSVLLDSNHGAGGMLGRRLLEKLGCRIASIGAEPDGQFAHAAEPTGENLADVARRAAEGGFDVTFCQDPDADRLAIIDENGRYPGEEFTLAICAKHVLSQNSGPVVANCATSHMTQRVAEKQGAAYHRSAVGEANVVDEMIRVGAVFGGEGNGGPIDPRVVLVRDSFVGMALILDAMAARGKTCSELVEELPRCHIHKTKFSLPPEAATAAMELLIGRFPEARADRCDGLRLDWPDRWLLVRPSNTEPIVRAIAEAPTPEEAAELCRRAESALR